MLWAWALRLLCLWLLLIMKKFIAIIIIILVLGILIAVAYFWYAQNKSRHIEQVSEKGLEETEVAKESALSMVIETNQRGDVLMVQKPEYQIVYLKEFDQFMISITQIPFEEIRQKAEQEFLQITKANEIVACQLNVVVTSPHFANPGLAGQRLPLSFCQE